jgi:hypothetical protein
MGTEENDAKNVFLTKRKSFPEMIKELEKGF